MSPKPKLAERYGLSGLEVMSVKRSYMMLLMIALRYSVIWPMSVAFSCSGWASLRQASSMDGFVVSGSVMMPTMGSAWATMARCSFGCGFSHFGITEKISLILASVRSTSTSPTTTTACMSGWYQVA